jgi:two-component system sensor histidine kinase KdpD
MAKRLATELATALGAVALTTLLLQLVRPFVWLPNFAMLYLLAVLAIAIRVGQRASVLAAIASFLAFNFFFVDPIHTLVVADSAQWMALLLLLVAGVVTGQLAETARQRSLEASAREREARLLFDVVRLVDELPLEAALEAVARRLREALDADAVLIRVDALATPVEATDGAPEALARARVTAREPRRMLERGSPGGDARWIRIRPWAIPGLRNAPGVEPVDVRISSEGRDLGRIVVVSGRPEARFGPADERLLLAAGSQLGRAAERQALQREATEAEVLRRTDELRTTMLRAVSHDLRTPLASIIAAAQSLQARDVSWSEAEREDFARSIEVEARRVDRMVSHLLDLSRIEAGALRLDLQWRDAGDAILDAVAGLRSASDAHRLRVDLPGTLPPVQFDAVAIGEVLANLVGNAVAHTPAGTEITVAAREIEGGVEIEVRDSGPGLSPAALAHLFEPFAGNATDRARTQGSGLGLAVAQRLVEAHGGRLCGGNDARGGARFWFSLPTSRAVDLEAGAAGEGT